MWNYEIYEIGSCENDKEKGKAGLIEFERLLPNYLQSVIYEEREAKIFTLKMISKNTVYKIWK